jgi:phospholipase C
MSEGRRAGELRLMLTNAGGRPCAITVEANAYLHEPPQRFWLQPGGHAEAHFDIGGCDHWYDFTATSDADTLFVRRFAGHQETGRASFSDPALGD